MSYFTSEEETILGQIKQTNALEEWWPYLPAQSNLTIPHDYPKDRNAYVEALNTWIDQQVEDEMLLFQFMYDLVAVVINTSKSHGVTSGLTLYNSAPETILTRLTHYGKRAFETGLNEIVTQLQNAWNQENEDYGIEANLIALEMLEEVLHPVPKTVAKGAFNQFVQWLNFLVFNNHVPVQRQQEVIEKAVAIYFLQNTWEKYAAPKQAKTLLKDFAGQFRYTNYFGKPAPVLQEIEAGKELPRSSENGKWEKLEIYWCIDQGNRLWLVNLATKKGWGWITLSHDREPMVINPITSEKVYFQSYITYEQQTPLALPSKETSKDFYYPFLHTPAQLLQNARLLGFKEFAPIIDFEAHNIDISQWQVLKGGYLAGGGWGYHVLMEQFVWLNPQHTYWTEGALYKTHTSFDRPDAMESVVFETNTTGLIPWLHYCPVDNNNYIVWPIELLGREQALHSNRNYDESVLEQSLKTVYPNWTDARLAAFTFWGGIMPEDDTE